MSIYPNKLINFAKCIDEMLTDNLMLLKSNNKSIDDIFTIIKNNNLMTNSNSPQTCKIRPIEANITQTSKNKKKIFNCRKVLRKRKDSFRSIQSNNINKPNYKVNHKVRNDKDDKSNVNNYNLNMMNFIFYQDRKSVV